MNKFIAVMSVTTALAMPALASADKPTTNPGKGHDKTAQGKAYGKYCQGESKTHVKGEKGTAFSRCVAAAKTAAETDATPKEACATASKAHVKGEKGTPYSRCVVAAAQAKQDATS